MTTICLFQVISGLTHPSKQATCWTLSFAQEYLCSDLDMEGMTSSTLFESDQFLAQTILTTANRYLVEFLSELTDGFTEYLVKLQQQEISL